MSKICKVCDQVKLLSAFRSHGRDGHANRCLLCDEVVRLEGIESLRARTSLYPAQTSAMGKLKEAIKSGKVSRPEVCEECGATGIVHAHHDDYDFPLEVRGLCPKHHVAWHAVHGPGRNRYKRTPRQLRAAYLRGYMTEKEYNQERILK